MTENDSALTQAAADSTQMPESAEAFVHRVISNPQSPLVMFGMDYCEFTWAARKLLDALEVKYEMVNLGDEAFEAEHRGRRIREVLQTLSGSPTTPQVFVSGTSVGGATDLFDEYKEGSFQKMLQSAGLQFTHPPGLDPYSLLPHMHCPI